MVALQPYEWALNDTFVFGGLNRPGTNNIFVSTFDPGGKPDGTFGDAARAGQDGTSFGIDTLNGGLITLGIVVNGQTDTGRDAYNALQAMWTDDYNRQSAETMSTLSMNLGGSVPLRIYGRPRNFGPSDLTHLKNGLVEITATFQMADNRYYGETLKSTLINAIPPENLSAQIVNANYSFETDVTGWTSTGAVLTQSDDQAQSGTYSAKITPDGMSDSAVTRSDPFVLALDGRYHFGVLVYSDVPQVVSVGFTYYAGNGSQISTSEISQTCSAGAWTKAVLTDLSPDGAVNADVYVGTDNSAVVYLDEARAQEMPGIAFPMRFPMQLAGRGHRSEGVNNKGTLSTWPVFTFNGPCVNPGVKYQGTSRKFGINMTLRRGESVTVDTHPWAATILRNDGASLAGNATGAQLQELALAPGTTIIGFTAQDNTGLASLTVDYRDASATP